MNKIKIYFLFCILLSACYSSDKPPSNVIKPDEMKNILWDVISAQVLASQLSLKDSSINQAAETKALSHEIFNIHHTDSATFSNSYNWYIKHPDILKRIFDSLYAQKQRESVPKLKINHKDGPVLQK